MSEIFADTAIVTTGFFTHYCHPSKTLMMLRVNHRGCPICNQKNPDYLPNIPVWTVLNIETGATILTFGEEAQAIKYIYDHPRQPLALGDTGYVK